MLSSMESTLFSSGETISAATHQPEPVMTVKEKNYLIVAARLFAFANVTAGPLEVIHALLTKYKVLTTDYYQKRRHSATVEACLAMQNFDDILERLMNERVVAQTDDLAALRNIFFSIFPECFRAECNNDIKILPFWQHITNELFVSAASTTPWKDCLPIVDYCHMEAFARIMPEKLGDMFAAHIISHAEEQTYKMGAHCGEAVGFIYSALGVLHNKLTASMIQLWVDYAIQLLATPRAEHHYGFIGLADGLIPFLKNNSSYQDELFTHMGAALGDYVLKDMDMIMGIMIQPYPFSSKRYNDKLFSTLIAYSSAISSSVKDKIMCKLIMHTDFYRYTRAIDLLHTFMSADQQSMLDQKLGACHTDAWLLCQQWQEQHRTFFLSRMSILIRLPFAKDCDAALRALLEKFLRNTSAGEFVDLNQRAAIQQCINTLLDLLTETTEKALAEIAAIKSAEPDTTRLSDTLLTLEEVDRVLYEGRFVLLFDAIRLFKDNPDFTRQQRLKCAQTLMRINDLMQEEVNSALSIFKCVLTAISIHPEIISQHEKSIYHRLMNFLIPYRVFKDRDILPEDVIGAFNILVSQSDNTRIRQLILHLISSITSSRIRTADDNFDIIVLHHICKQFGLRLTVVNEPQPTTARFI